jgi:hypothetical protein
MRVSVPRYPLFDNAAYANGIMQWDMVGNIFRGGV